MWPRSANASVFIVINWSTSGEAALRICSNLSVVKVSIEPNLASILCVLVARRSLCLVLLSSLSHISTLTRGTISFSQLLGLEYFSIFSFCFVSGSFVDHRLLTISASCWFIVPPTCSSCSKSCEISWSRASCSSQTRVLLI